jgi:AraC-like DNA-binding protein
LPCATVNADSIRAHPRLVIIASIMLENSRQGDVSSRSELLEDIDSIAPEMADGVQGEYVQLESRPFRGRWTTVRADDIVVQFGFAEIAVLRRLRVPADRWAFMAPLAVPAEARWNGHRVRSTDLIVCPPQVDCLAFDPASTRFAIVTIDTHSPLVRLARRLISETPPSPLAAACGPECFVLRERLTSVREYAERNEPAALAESMSIVADSLTACLKGAVSRDEDAGAGVSRSRIVSRAEEFFRRHLSEGVSVVQLSTIAGVSERSLRNAFYDVYTTSPKRYLKLWQLHQVRRALRAAHVRTATVTEVATGHGFYELGRFAGAYKSLFGEAPSETLSKAKHRTAIDSAA